MGQSNSQLVVKPVTLDQAGRLKTYFDTKAVVQNQAVINFFTPNANRRSAQNNYVNNPFPGDEVRKVLGISIESTLAVIKTAANVDPIKIINALKFGSVKLTLNSDSKQALHLPITDFLDFSAIDVSVAADPVDGVFVTLPTKGMVRLPDPFQIGKNQVFEAIVEFDSAANFPTSAHWTTAAYGDLQLRFGIQVSEEIAG